MKRDNLSDLQTDSVSWLKLVFVIGVLAAIVFRYALSIAADPDLWGHTKYGIDHIQLGTLQKTDPYSFTAFGDEWINHEWLTELTFGYAYLIGGNRGLLTVRSLILSLMIGLLFILWWWRWPHGFFLLAVAIFCVAIVALFTNIRPQSFSFLLTVVVFFIFELYRRGQRLWLNTLPVIMALWTNLHGGFVVGLALMSLGLVSFLCGTDDLGRRPTASERRHLATLLLLSWLAPLCNPYGFRLLTYLAMALSLKRANITEWQAVSIKPMLQNVYLLIVCVTSILCVVSTGWRRLTDTSFFVICAVMTAMRARIFPFMVIAASLVMMNACAALWAQHVVQKNRQSFRLLAPNGPLVYLMLIPGVLMLVLGLTDLRQHHYRVYGATQDYPTQAVRFLKQHRLGPNLSVNFNWSQYAIWHLYPAYKVSSDGRYETVYEPKFVESQLVHYYAGNVEGYTANLDIDAMLFERQSKLADAIAKRPDWVKVYEDTAAVIYVPYRSAALARLQRQTLPYRPQQESGAFFYFP